MTSSAPSSFRRAHLVLARRAGDHFGAEHLGEDDAAGADAAGRAEDEHLVALLDRLVRDDHAVRGAVGDRQRRRLLEASRLSGMRDELVGRDEAVFRHAAVEHLAHQALLLVERIDEHAVAGLPAGHARADLGDLARHVEADDDRQRHLDAGHAPHGEDVVIVERRRPDADDDMAFDGFGLGMVVDDFEIFETAMLAEQ